MRILSKQTWSQINRWSTILLIVPLLAGILFAGGFFSFASSEGQSETIQRLRVATQSVSATDHYEIDRSYLGQIESVRQSQLSFELGGKLNRILVDEGDVVQKGDLLAELDTQILQSQFHSLSAQADSAKSKLDELINGPRSEVIAAAKANVRQWEARQKLAQITSKRQDRLVNSNATSKQAYEEAIYNEEAIDAQLAASKSVLEELVNGTRTEQIQSQRAHWLRLCADARTIEIQIGKSQLKAPFDGIVSARMIDEGVVIDVGQPVLDIFDNRKLEIRIGLPSSVAAEFNHSTDAKLFYNDQLLGAKFKAIRPEKNPSTRTVDVLYSIADLSLDAPIGEVVELRTKQTVNESGYWIPVDALVEHYRGLWGCYILQKSGHDERVKLTELELLYQKGGSAFVRGPLQANDQVVVSGVHRLVANQIVHAINRDTSIASTGQSLGH